MLLLLGPLAADESYHSWYECSFDSARYFSDAIGTSCPSYKDLMTKKVHYVDSKYGKVEAMQWRVCE